jgi:hypothetical protein
MTEIQNPIQKQSLTRRKRLRCALNRFGICNLRFICNLVLGICDFKKKFQGRAINKQIWPKRPGFSGQNKGDGIRI